LFAEGADIRKHSPSAEERMKQFSTSGSIKVSNTQYDPFTRVNLCEFIT
jgi:hypothetical protein